MYQQMYHVISGATVASMAIALCVSSPRAQERLRDRYPLPLPPAEELVPAEPLELPEVPPEQKTLEDLRVERQRVLDEINRLELLLARQAETICGLLDDSQHVELYDGALGPSRSFIDFEEGSTAQIQWRDDLQQRFSASGASPGNVSGLRWCSGTLISPTLLLTAAHCFDIDPNGWRTPRKVVSGQTVPVPPPELATLMVVNFKYQVDGTNPGIFPNPNIRQPDVFPITQLVEYGREPARGGLDYAIVELGPNENGGVPGDLYQIADMDTSSIALQRANRLTIIQHPHGDPKKVEAGPLFSVVSSSMQYADLDTRGGSSGAGIIDDRGALIGVHTHGGCTGTGGTNGGITLHDISRVSDLID